MWLPSCWASRGSHHALCIGDGVFPEGQHHPLHRPHGPVCHALESGPGKESARWKAGGLGSWFYRKERNGGDQLWGKTKMTAELELKCRFLSKQAGE